MRGPWRHRLDCRVLACRVLFALGACSVLAACGEQARGESAAPAAERPLLGAPDPTGPTSRGVYLKDPAGQVESIAAGGHLVAWTVQAPADDVPGEDEDPPHERPPAATKLVVADERGGTPITVRLGARWVSTLRMLRGPGGPSEPQFAVESCAT